MYHIVKTKSKAKPFQVINISANNEVINTSQLLKSKQAAFKNIDANMGTIFSDSDADYYCLIQDDTLKVPKVYEFYDTGEKKELDSELHKPTYIPGKNPKNKTK